MRLAGKRALITGAGSGIGRETALLFARDGAHVAAADRDVGGAEETAKLVRESGGTAVAIGTDVSEGAAVETMVCEAEEALGGRCHVNHHSS